MKHASKLIARILFLEGAPEVSVLGPIKIGINVPAQFSNDLGAEMTAVARYREAVTLCQSLGDAATRNMLEEILGEEDGHVNYIEAQLDQIAQMGAANYLANQVGN
jgi:bacterioferritin